MSIISLLNRVREEELVLPNIQRSFVWDPDDICKLMDSIMRGYPIGIVLMWDTYADIQYRHFTSSYVPESNFEYSSNQGGKKLLLVLDGQQRLQSLYIALYGKYLGKQLYFELLSGQDRDDSSEIKYNFEFLSEKEVYARNRESEDRFSDPWNDDIMTDHEKEYWLPVKALFEMEYEDFQDQLDQLKKSINVDRGERKLIERNLNHLKTNFQQSESLLQESILDNNKAPDAKSRKTPTDILEVFVRINREGTRLSKSDLVFSMLKLNWQESAVDLPGFVEELNRKTDFDFDKDFVIKALFTCSEFGPKYDIDILRKKSNVDRIMNNYPACCDAINSCLDFLRQHCWIRSKRTLPGYNILIPFVYYIYRLPNHLVPEASVTDLRKFFYIAAFTRLFTRYADFRIRIFVRDYLRKKLDSGDTAFSLADGIAFLRRYDDFQGFDDYHFNASTRLVLNLVQREYDMNLLFENNVPEIDHIFPKSKLREKGLDEQTINHYANYWYLPKRRNRSKSNRHPKQYLQSLGFTDAQLQKAFIDADLLDYRRYSTFITDRSEKIRAHVLAELEMTDNEFRKAD